MGPCSGNGTACVKSDGCESKTVFFKTFTNSLTLQNVYVMSVQLSRIKQKRKYSFEHLLRRVGVQQNIKTLPA